MQLTRLIRVWVVWFDAVRINTSVVSGWAGSYKMSLSWTSEHPRGCIVWWILHLSSDPVISKSCHPPPITLITASNLEQMNFSNDFQGMHMSEFVSTHPSVCSFTVSLILFEIKHEDSFNDTSANYPLRWSRKNWSCVRVLLPCV